MSKLVPNLFQREALRQQMRRACVAQGVRPMMGNGRSQPTKARADDAVDASTAKRTAIKRQKHLSV